MKSIKYSIIVVTILLLSPLALISQESTVLDGIMIKEHTPQRKSVTYGSGGPLGSPLIREANVMWQKRIWRALDMREKVNHPLYYPISPIQDRRSMFDVIKDAILVEGTLTAYDPGPLGDDDEFTVPLTVEQVKKMMFSVDTVYTEDLETFELVPQVVTTELKTEKVKRYEMKEEWFFDRERSVMDVRILGMCPMVEKIDELTGEFRGYSPLFWIYFPEARHVFINAEVFNRKNDAERRTMDDILWKRQFGSYIVKESNVFDRVISEYKSNLDALLEAEKVKNDIFVMEHDLWHF